MPWWPMLRFLFHLQLSKITKTNRNNLIKRKHQCLCHFCLNTALYDDCVYSIVPFNWICMMVFQCNFVTVKLYFVTSKIHQHISMIWEVANYVHDTNVSWLVISKDKQCHLFYDCVEEGRNDRMFQPNTNYYWVVVYVFKLI